MPMARGRPRASFEEKLFCQARQAQGAIKLKQMWCPSAALDADLWDALVLGVRDYMWQERLPGAMLGLSGGIDSALVLAIAVDALGADKVRAVMMPSPYTADISWIDARDMAERLGVRYDEISIAPSSRPSRPRWRRSLPGLPEDTTEENLQARIRGTLLMALSNKTGAWC
jgi:NAD+ synthase (glutamine-hydrolysing)